MQRGIAIPLHFQYDHIESALLFYSEHNCAIYLKEEVASRSYIRLSFKRALSVRSAATELSPALNIFPEDPTKSFIVELTQSSWPQQARDQYAYATSSQQPRGRHFVLTNHDIFHEILADSFEESLVQPDDAIFPVLIDHFNP